VAVAVKRSLWVAVGGVVAGQVPDNESLITTSREEHIWVLHRGSQTGDPSAVASEGTLQDQLLRHDGRSNAR